MIEVLFRGVIVKEDEKAFRWEERKDKTLKPGERLLVLHYRGCVKALEGARDPYFTVKLELPKQTFTQGEEAYFSITSSQDGYLTLVVVDASNRVHFLLPSPYFPSKISSGVRMEFPSREQRAAGLKFRVKLPEGASRSTEMVMAVATKQPVDFYKLACRKKKGVGTCDEKTPLRLESFLEALLRLPLNQWQSDTVVYTVRLRSPLLCRGPGAH